MNDPHVDFLIYRLATADSLVFDNPPPLSHQSADFDLRLEDAHLTVTMRGQFPERRACT